jgi:hypothetical protein
MSATTVQTMIPEKPVPDLIRDGCRFPEKVMVKKQDRALSRFHRDGTGSSQPWLTLLEPHPGGARPATVPNKGSAVALTQ